MQCVVYIVSYARGKYAILRNVVYTVSYARAKYAMLFTQCDMQEENVQYFAMRCLHSVICRRKICNNQNFSESCDPSYDFVYFWFLYKPKNFFNSISNMPYYKKRKTFQKRRTHKKDKYFALNKESNFLIRKIFLDDDQPALVIR